MARRGKTKDSHSKGNRGITTVFKEEIANIHTNKLMEIL
jgi:hypothetical protein